MGGTRARKFFEKPGLREHCLRFAPGCASLHDMLKSPRLILTLFFCVSLVVVGLAGKAPPPAPPASTSTQAPGLGLAQSISAATGVAISPLLGVSVVGSWQYFHATPAQRGSLSWYAHPLFWITGFLIVGAVGLKDVLGTALPPGLKKPFDVAEVCENKVSGLVAAGALIPMVGSFMSTFAPATDASLAQGGLAFMDITSVQQVVVLPFALVAFVMVWLVSHAINILILLSPWGVIDAMLKSARLFLLMLMASIACINPWLGAFLSLIIIAIAYFLAGWSLRLMVYGSVYSWDFFTLRRMRFHPEAGINWAFTARKIQAVPIRTYGKLVRDGGGKFTLQYRPWLVLPGRTLDLTGEGLAVGNGFFNPVLVEKRDGETQALLTFPPRYRDHEQDLARLYELPVEDVGLLKGLKMVWGWIRELFGFGKPVALMT